jgi:hypothetical protein
MSYTGISDFFPPDYFWKSDLETIQPSPFITPTSSIAPSLVNHSVSFTDPNNNPIGTVTFTSQSGNTFQGTWSPAPGAATLTSKLNLGDTYTETTNIGLIPVSGTFYLQSSGAGGFTWSISFSGTYLQNGGMGVGAEEDHTYIDTNGNPQTEIWGVPDTQTVSFNGTMTGSGSNVAFSGALTEGVHADWIGDADFLPPSSQEMATNHQVGPDEGPFAFGAWLDTSSTWGMASGNLQ